MPPADYPRNRRAVDVVIIVILLLALAGVLVYAFVYRKPIQNGTTPTPTVTTTTTVTTSPTGTTTGTPVAMQVTGVDLSASPTDVSGIACNTNLTVTYTAVFHIIPNSTGGTINFMWTANNGRSSTNASTSVNPGETSKTYTFTSSGTLTQDHTYPGVADIIVTTPNEIHSNQVVPAGACK